MKLAAAILALLFAGMLGYIFRGDRNQAAITAAANDAAVCRSSLESNGTALDEVKRQLADLRDRHAKALAAATASLDERDAQIAALRADAEKRSDTIKGVIRVDAECAALDRMPLCAAVAGRLWPAAAALGGADHAH